MFQAREKSLVELSAFRDHCTLGEWVVKFPALVALWVANKHAFLHVGREAISLVPLHMHIGSAAPDSKMRDVWLPAIPQLIGRRIRACRGVGAVQDMHIGEKGFPPELLGQLGLCKECCDPI